MESINWIKPELNGIKIVFCLDLLVMDSLENRKIEKKVDRVSKQKNDILEFIDVEQLLWGSVILAGT